jgi:hypothetical protein
MSKLTSLAIAGGALALSGAALAHPPLVNDASYVAAARCFGLSTSHDLPPFDAGPIGRFMAAQGAGRTASVTDQANDARDRARRDAATAGPDGRDHLMAERVAYPCRMYGRIGARGGY